MSDSFTLSHGAATAVVDSVRFEFYINSPDDPLEDDLLTPDVRRILFALQPFGLGVSGDPNIEFLDGGVNRIWLDFLDSRWDQYNPLLAHEEIFANNTLEVVA